MNILWAAASDIMRAYGMSFVVTGIGTIISILLTTSLAYAISKSNLPGKKFLTFFVFFTMLFNGGLVPTYLMYTGTFHIKNTIFCPDYPEPFGACLLYYADAQLFSYQSSRRGHGSGGDRRRQ